MILYKIKPEYIYQHWYRTGVFKLSKSYGEKYMPSFGIDCEWIDLETGERIHIWDRCMMKLSNEEAKRFLRELNLQKLGL